MRAEVTSSNAAGSGRGSTEVRTSSEKATCLVGDATLPPPPPKLSLLVVVLPLLLLPLLLLLLLVVLLLVVLPPNRNRLFDCDDDTEVARTPAFTVGLTRLPLPAFTDALFALPRLIVMPPRPFRRTGPLGDTTMP